MIINLYDIIDLGIDIFLIGKLMRELRHTALSDVSGLSIFGMLFDVSVREDKIVVCGYNAAALFKLIY